MLSHCLFDKSSVVLINMKDYQNRGDDKRDGYAAAEKYGGSSFKKKSFGDRDGGYKSAGCSFGGDRDGGKGGFGGDRGGFGGGKSGFGGGYSGSRGGSGDRGSRGGFGGDRPPVTMHKAICTECNKDCEVPFRPTGDKPVLCQNCFNSKKDSYAGGRDSYEKSPSKYSSSSEGNNLETTNAINALKAQISDINFKLDKLTRMMEKIQQNTIDNVYTKTKELEVNLKKEASIKNDIEKDIDSKISEGEDGDTEEMNSKEIIVKEKKAKKVAVKKVATVKKATKKVK